MAEELVTLVDDDGNEGEFKPECEMQIGERVYLVLTAVNAEEEVAIVRVIDGEMADLEEDDDFERLASAADAVLGGEPYCRECGCTDDHACGIGCSWAEADLCSACDNKAELEQHLAQSGGGGLEE